MRNYALGAVGLFLLTSSAFAFDNNLNSETGVTLGGNFAEPTDVSGIACSTPADTWPQDCVVVVDEGIAAQRATIANPDTGYELTPGKRLALLRFDGNDVLATDTSGKAYPVFGSPPEQTSCTRGVKRANEIDAEGVTFAAGSYFVTGSIGCGRKNDAARMSAFIVAKFASGADPGQVLDPAGEVSFRLVEAILAQPQLADHFAHDLGGEGPDDTPTDSDQSGVSIEGVAAIGTPLRLYFGLRSPTSGNSAFLLSVDAEALFSNDKDLAAKLELVDLSKAGDRMGIRDLATIEDEPDRLLMLIGPALGETGKAAVADYIVDDDDQDELGRLGPVTVFDNPPKGKAEGLLLLDRLATKAKVLFLHDGIPDGAPAISIVPLQ